jgi:hypothetical protein
MDLKPIIDRAGEKTMLRAYSGEQKGATAFFRNRPLLETLMDLLWDQATVLFHASSIGAEVYSFAIYARMRGIDVQISATDINPDFLSYSRLARYPAEILDTMSSEEQAYFRHIEDEVMPVEEIRKMVDFLPPASFVDTRIEEPFDVVFVTNAMTYVTEAEQAIAIDNIARYNRRVLVASAFHPDMIERDLTRNGYAPVLNNVSAIHNAWEERIRVGFTAQRGTPEYSWVLPPFSEVEGWRFKYCSIFEKCCPSAEGRHFWVPLPAVTAR